jgi:HK97 family phage major capsid protein
MDLKAQRLALVKAAMDIVAGAKAAARDLTDEERTDLERKHQEVADLTKKIDQAEKDAELLKGFEALLPEGSGGDGEDQAAESLGQHFAKALGQDGARRLKSTRGTTIATTEWMGPGAALGVKAATDPNTSPAVFQTPVLTQYDRFIRRAFRRASVADLLGSGTLGRGTNAVSYFIEGSVEGNFATVAEGGQKPQLHFTDPTMTTDSVKKIAGWWDTADEMIEDLDFWVSEINNRGLYLLEMVEESQLLSGDGTGTNVLGLLNRSGIQTVTQAVAPDNAPDTIFRAITAVQTATGLPADGIMINPADYQTLRLSKDANSQYMGGGFFAGQYGTGGIDFQPPVWGLRTIVTAAVPAKTFVVGAFQAATTVYRKGGVRVESTNSDGTKFTKDIVTTRIEERVALAVRMPAAIVKGTLL